MAGNGQWPAMAYKREPRDLQPRMQDARTRAVVDIKKYLLLVKYHIVTYIYFSRFDDVPRSAEANNQ